MPLRSISSAGPGQSEEYSSAQADDIIEEVGPGDDVTIGSDLSTLVVPFPELAPVVFFCLKQTTCPRNWCIRMVSSPYPFIYWGKLTLNMIIAYPIIIILFTTVSFSSAYRLSICSLIPSLNQSHHSVPPLTLTLHMKFV